MKKIIKIFVSIALGCFIILALPISGEEGLYSSVMRLHILANSDSEEDQALKLGVRDRLILEFGDEFSSYSGIDEADADVSSRIGEIESVAEAYVLSAGYDYGVRVTLGKEEYPTRNYGEISLPSGEYLSLRVIIGEGQGENWWCVLFPPMCTEAALGEVIDYSDVSAGLTKEQYNVISEGDRAGYAVRFKALEILEKIFG